MKPGEWLLKIRRYDGSDSVLRDYGPERDAARAEAARLNAEVQTDQYYVEEVDTRLEGRLPRHGRRNRPQ